MGLSTLKTRILAITLIFLSLCSITTTALAAPNINVMAPLLIGNPSNPDAPENSNAWAEFQNQLKVLKQCGVHGISTDVWWGIIEANGPGQFDWNYYEKMARIIHSEGLKWMPILSFHQLRDNVGDVGYVPLPNWVWSEYQNDPAQFKSENDMMFKSELGNFSREYVSFWATDLVLNNYRRVMLSFRDHFSKFSDLVEEINISLGPSGELRYPSYNSHDQGSGYPTRGALQAYSNPAVKSFRKAMLQKYQSIGNLNRAWGFELSSFDEIYPPDPKLLSGAYWQNKEQFSAYGKDFFDWYNQSLIEHGQKMFDLANSVFGAPDSTFKGAVLGGKIPGIHWRIGSDRLAELAAGLIRTSYPDWSSGQFGYGYADTLRVFESTNSTMKKVLHFTALEMDDYRDEDRAAVSRAKTLVRWISEAAIGRHIEIKGENALAEELSYTHSWDNMFEAMTRYGYTGITLLRSNEITPFPQRIEMLTNFYQRLEMAFTYRRSELY